MLRLFAILIALCVPSLASAQECYMRSNICAATSGKICHLQIWNPEGTTTFEGVTYKRVVRIDHISVSRSTGFFLVKHGASPGEMTGDIFSPSPANGLSVLDDMPVTVPPLNPANWWYSAARMKFGLYTTPIDAGQYLYHDGAGMIYDVKLDRPIELGPNSGLVVRNANPNQGVNATFQWCESWVAVP